MFHKVCPPKLGGRAKRRGAVFFLPGIVFDTREGEWEAI